jgi:hypothetical protein
MKAFTKISSVFIVAAITAAFTAGLSNANDVGMKRGGLEYKGPQVSLFAKPDVSPVPAMKCASCKPEFVAVATQDTKLKTRSVVLEQHACKACSTTIARVGAQKATGKDVSQHSCGGRVIAAVETCCAGMAGTK